MNKWICIISLLPVLAGFSLSSYGSPPEPPLNIPRGDYQAVTTYLNKLTRYWIDEDDLLGLSIAVVSGDDVVWEKGFGLSNVEVNRQTSKDTVYRVGSISCAFTASLILRLAELGKLNLDDNVAQYLPEIKFKYHEKKEYVITIRNLLTHHAGLPISRFEGSWTKEEIDLRTNLQILTHQLNQSYASYPPNTIYAYSNIGYSLLALIVERVTKSTFETALEQYVVKPLNLTHTGIRFSEKIKSHIATGYRKGEPQDFLFPRDVASLGMYSTANDVGKLMRMLLGQGDGLVVSNASLQLMLSPQNEHVLLDLEKYVTVGMNVGDLEIENAGPVIWRAGSTLAFKSRMAMLPKHNIGVVILSNDARSWDALKEISEKALQLMLQVRTGIKKDTESPEKDIVDNLLKYELADYYTSFAGFIPVEKEKDKITAQLLGWPLIVTLGDDGWYTIKYDLFGFIPIDVSWVADIKVKPGRVDDKSILLANYKGENYLVGYHSAFNTLNDAWLKRQGEYRVVNHDVLLDTLEIKDGNLVVEGDKLFFNYKLPNVMGFELQVPLQTLSADLAIIPGLGTALNETLEVKHFGNQEYLEYSGYLLEKVEQAPSMFDFF